MPRSKTKNKNLMLSTQKIKRRHEVKPSKKQLRLTQAKTQYIIEISKPIHLQTLKQCKTERERQTEKLIYRSAIDSIKKTNTYVILRSVNGHTGIVETIAKPLNYKGEKMYSKIRHAKRIAPIVNHVKDIIRYDENKQVCNMALLTITNKYQTIEYNDMQDIDNTNCIFIEKVSKAHAMARRIQKDNEKIISDYMLIFEAHATGYLHAHILLILKKPIPFTKERDKQGYSVNRSKELENTISKYFINIGRLDIRIAKSKEVARYLAKSELNKNMITSEIAYRKLTGQSINKTEAKCLLNNALNIGIKNTNRNIRHKNIRYQNMKMFRTSLKIKDMQDEHSKDYENSKKLSYNDRIKVYKMQAILSDTTKDILTTKDIRRVLDYSKTNFTSLKTSKPIYITLSMHMHTIDQRNKTKEVEIYNIKDKHRQKPLFKPQTMKAIQSILDEHNRAIEPAICSILDEHNRAMQSIHKVSLDFMRHMQQYANVS